MALRYLSYRPRSELEVKKYLRQKGCEPQASEAVIDKLRSLHYLDDLSFAQLWARSRLESRGYGPRRVEQELRIKGIGANVIRETIQQSLNHRSEQESARKILTKRFGDASLQDAKAQRRAVALLQRRGFSSQVIFDLLQYRIDED
ncbi:MAG: regulatory protein RecX [Candidatus Binatia bacterium]